MMTCHEQWFLARGEAAVEFPDATVQRKIEIQTVLTDYLECHLMVRLSLKAPIQKFRPLSTRKFRKFLKISNFRDWVNNLGRGFWLMKKDRDVPIPPKRSNSSVSDLPTIPGEGPFEEIVNIPKKSYSVVNLSQPEKRKAATLPRKSSQAKVRLP